MLNTIKRFLKRLIVFLIVIVAMISLAVAMIFWHLNSLNPEMINVPLKQTNKIRIKHGGQYSELLVRKCDPLRFNQMPLLIKKSYTHFYSSPGCRPTKGHVVTSVIYDILKVFGNFSFYDPSIIYRLAHNSLVISRGSYPFRSEEVALAVKIYEKYDKEKILESYLNQLYFGRGVFGYEAAAQYYFGKRLVELEPHQIALLGGMAVTYYSIHMEERHNQFLKGKVLKRFRDHALDVMSRENLLSSKEVEFYKRKPLGIIIKIEE